MLVLCGVDLHSIKDYLTLMRQPEGARSRSQVVDAQVLGIPCTVQSTLCLLNPQMLIT